MVNWAWTPPSGERVDRFFTNRASRVGPLAVMKLETAASWPGGAIETCGLAAGLAPPTPGAKGQLEQLVAFNLRPTPPHPPPPPCNPLPPSVYTPDSTPL